MRFIFIGAFVACFGMMAQYDESPMETEAISTASADHEVDPLQGTCGDGQCQPPEDCNTCPRDCGTCCGNTRCEPPEDCRSCPQDCGPCS